MDELGLTVVTMTLVVLVMLGLAEAWMHRRTLARFKIRVHVNGTRGKSSVTRLIAAGLRAGGRRVCAKTTGTLPRLIHPDGIEEPVYRVGRPNVIEQLGVARRAARLGADTLVVECMALQPFLQWVSTAALVRPTHGVVTNIRADHLDVMGPTSESVALALAGSVPHHAQLFTAETRFTAILERAARDRDTELIKLDATDAGSVSEAELMRFSYIEHAENVALALRVCIELDVPRAVALAGMQMAKPDPGALTLEYYRISGRQLCFINGFAANDPESTGQVWELALTRTEPRARRIALINCRDDRPERSAQLGEAAPQWTMADLYFVCGSGTWFFTSAAEKSGLPAERLRVLEQEPAERLVDRLAEAAGDGGVVVGMGNIGGVGLALIEALKERAELS